MVLYGFQGFEVLGKLNDVFACRTHKVDHIIKQPEDCVGLAKGGCVKTLNGDFKCLIKLWSLTISG